MSQDIRAWPMLALLLLVVAVAIGCVLWFMREAIGNERLAVRQKLAQAYQGQLTLLQKRVEEQWRGELERLQHADPGQSLFATAVREHWADAVICLDESGRATYPQFTSSDRDTEANAQLLALEKITDRADPKFAAGLDRLIQRVSDYDKTRMPAPQRRFLMRELQKLRPGLEFPTLAAEDLAGEISGGEWWYRLSHCAPTKLARPDLWACTAGRVVLLFKTSTLRENWSDLRGRHCSRRCSDCCRCAE
jgi:hypothetical protein